MMDVLGYRHKLAIVAPSTNTVVQPEMDEMRPDGHTHFAQQRATNCSGCDT